MENLNSNIDINFTGIVVTLNEERYLSACLSRLNFCDQLIVIDLGSSDSSCSIAQSYEATLIQHKRVFCQEEVREKYIKLAKYDWIVSVDPDEILPEKVELAFRENIRKNPNLGSINLPWVFYFRGKVLKSTVWGCKREKTILSHKKRNRFTPYVHRGVKLLDGFESLSLPRKEEYSIKHFWADSYQELIEKHLRYIRLDVDGKSRYNNEERFSFYKWAKETLYGLKVNLFDFKGILNGPTGIFLSLFYACYVNLSLLSLLRYQIRMKKILNTKV